MAIKRPWNRAKIFQPFDALPGLRELLREKEIEHEVRFDADGNEASLLHEQEIDCLRDMGEDGRMESNDSIRFPQMKFMGTYQQLSPKLVTLSGKVIEVRA